MPGFDKKEMVKRLINHSEGRIMLMALSGNKRDAALGRILLAAHDREGPVSELYKYIRKLPVSVQDLGAKPLSGFINNCLKVFDL
jgi:hypothetical protein